MKTVLAACFALLTATALLAKPSGTFPAIDGGTINLADWAGKPVLVVNTASQCGFTGQYEGMQTLYDTYRAQGLIVLAIPSDDFNQELATAQEVKEFCELNYGLDFPMTDITRVKGTKAHSFYKQVKAETGFEPKWNFNKVLIGPDGEVKATWGSNVLPTSRKVVAAIEGLLD